MKIIITFFLALFFISNNLSAQSRREVPLKVTDFTKGLPTDLDKSAIIINKLDFMAQAYDPTTEENVMERHWKKFLKALESYPFKYFVVESDALGSEANEAKYEFRFYPEFTKLHLIMGGDKILTIKERNTSKHYGLKEQREAGNSKANYSFYEIKYFIKQVKNVYKIE